MIAGKNVRLWPLERHDLIQNYKWANNRELVRLAGMQPLPKSAGELERWYETTVGAADTRIFAIKTPDGEYLGNLELRDLDYRCGRAEVGILIGDGENQNKGYGSDALQALCRFSFRELRLHRLYARVLETNARAQRLFKKVGFKEEGVERQAHYARGRHWDILMFGLLRAEAKEDDTVEAD